MLRLGMARQPFRRSMLAVIDGVEDKLNPGRDAELVEDPEDVLLDGVFAEPKLQGNFLIGKSFGYERDYLLLARSEQAIALRVDNPQGWNLSYEVDEVVDLLRGGPYLAMVNHLDALAKGAKRGFGQAKQAARAGTKGAHREIPVAGFEQEDFGHVRMGKVKAAEQSKVGRLGALVVQGQDGDIGRSLVEGLQEKIRIERTGAEPELGPTTEGGGEQLKLQGTAIGEQDGDGATSGVGH
jgi:hypothetical protein